MVRFHSPWYRPSFSRLPAWTLVWPSYSVRTLSQHTIITMSMKHNHCYSLDIQFYVFLYANRIKLLHSSWCRLKDNILFNVMLFCLITGIVSCFVKKDIVYAVYFLYATKIISSCALFTYINPLTCMLFQIKDLWLFLAYWIGFLH